VKDPNNKSVFGHGMIGVGKYSVLDDNGLKTKEYITWHNMMSRCYSAIYQQKHPSYKGCTVCDEWLNYQNFAK
jgi:hypothetical protein